MYDDHSASGLLGNARAQRYVAVVEDGKVVRVPSFLPLLALLLTQPPNRPTSRWRTRRRRLRRRRRRTSLRSSKRASTPAAMPAMSRKLRHAPLPLYFRRARSRAPA